jgi:hypothetical protein
VHDAVAESVLVEEFEVAADARWERVGLPPPRIMGQTNSWHSSTRPASKARAARLAPPMVRGLGLQLFDGCLAGGRQRLLHLVSRWGLRV